MKSCNYETETRKQGVCVCVCVCGFKNCLKFTYNYHAITLLVRQLSSEVTVAEINTPGAAIYTQLTFFSNIITPPPETSHTLNNT